MHAEMGYAPGIPMKRILLYSPVFLAAHRLFIAASLFVVPGRR